MRVFLLGLLAALGATSFSLFIYEVLISRFPHDLSMFLSGVFIFTLITYSVVIAVGKDIVSDLDKKNIEET